MKQDRSFAFYTSQPDITEENSDRLRKMRNLFEILNKTFSKFCSSSEPVAVDEVIVCSKEGSFPTRNANVLASKFTNHVTRVDTRVIGQIILSLAGVRKFHIEILHSSS
jgi:Mg2+/Co2+ transporter CorC